MSYYCAMDVGGTSARLQIKEHTGTVLGEFVGKGCTLNVDGNELSEQRYREVVISALEQLALDAKDCLGICVAASGVDTKKNEIDCKEIFINMGFLPERIKICNDCAVFLLSSDEPDLIVISGTGSIAVGRTDEGFVRCGGWGHIISDEGSAYAMSFKIFRTVLNHLDGRCDSPILSEMLLEAIGLNSHTELNEYLMNNAPDRTNVACFAKLAENAAKMGDEGAKKILDECAQELFDLVIDTKKKLNKDPSENLTVWLWGSVIATSDRPVARLLEEKLTQREKNITVKFPRINAIDAAMKAAMRI